MSTLRMSAGITQGPTLSAEDLFARQVSGLSRRTDRLFAVLLTFQWVAAMATAMLRSPRTWEGESSRVHAHVWAAILLGGAIISLPVALSLARAGATSTRLVIAVAQALMGALLIHLTDGRIETHFHVFGSLALLAFYRDWRVLVTASAVIALDHLVRGHYWPQSAFGVLGAGPWRWAEHTAWVIVEDIFLIRSCLQNVREMRDIAEREADLSRANEGLAREVVERKRAEEANARLAAIVESSDDAVVSKDLSGIFTSWNAGAERLFGYTAEEMVGTPVTGLIPPDREIEETEILERLRRGERFEPFESIRIAKDGRMLDVSLTISPIRDAAGKVIGASKIARDISDRKRTEQEIRLLNFQLERRLNRLNALRQIDIAITASFDLGVTLSTLLDQVNCQLGVDAADILLLDPQSRTLKYVAGRGFRTDSMQEAHLSLDQSVPGLVTSEGIPLHLTDLTQAARPFLRSQAIEEEGFVAYSAVPLVSQGVVKGVMEVFHRSALESDQEWRDFLEVLAAQAAIAIDRVTLFQDLQRSNAELTVAYDATIEGWSRALDLRDKETEGHTRRVTEMTVRLARAMGLAGAGLINVRRGALLHDVGKLGVPDAILLKPGKLTDEEWTLMRRHPAYAHEWLSPIAFLRPALDIPYCHHEKWDGTGYPRGLKGEQIPPAARIFAAVDIWDALRSDRPYRQGWPEERVIEHIRSLAGTHLDPAVVAAFQKCLAGDMTEPVADSVATVTAVAESIKPTAAVEVDCAEEISLGRSGSPLLGRPGLKILIAEDHPHSARVLQRTLEAMGHNVLHAADGEEAWRVVEQDRAAVVIADWLMPGLHGLELCRRIRGQARRPYTYVILVSGLSGEQDRLKALHAGADDFLTKPLDPAQLNARLEVARRIFEANRELEGRNARLTELATTDDLTGLKNRRHFREAFESAFSFAARQGLPLSMVMLDVDHFKSFNDASATRPATAC